MFSGLMSGFKNFFASKSGGSVAPEHAGYRERRKLVRLRCAYEVKANIGDKKFKATIVDIGVEGLKLRTGQQLKIGDKVVLAPPGQGVSVQALPVEGKVVWIKTTEKSYARHAGLVFTTKKEDRAKTWVSMFLKELGFNPRMVYTKRRFIRADCFLDARYQARQVGREVTGRVYNLGLGGMLLETNYDLPPDEPTEMEFIPPEGLPVLRVLAYPVQVKKEGVVRLVGLEFRDLTQRQLDVLGQYLKLLLKISFKDQET
ncbi:MAG: PilZ domain-containing protein [Vulcanimicrobiota bacterium]